MNTVEEAQKLWCPMQRIARTGGGETLAAYNMIDDWKDGVSTGIGCISSACACWRWMPKEGERPEVIQEVSGFKRVITRHGPMTPTHGYCGLAGRPEVTA